MLAPFLDAVGAPLARAYGRQFAKLVEHILGTFLPRAHALPSLQEEERAALSRLETVAQRLADDMRAGRTVADAESVRMTLFKEEDDLRDEQEVGGNDW